MWQSLNGQHISLTALPLTICYFDLVLRYYHTLNSRFITRHLVTGLLGNSCFFFSREPLFPKTSAVSVRASDWVQNIFQDPWYKYFFLSETPSIFNRATVYKPLPIIPFNNIRYNLSLKFVFMFAAPMPQRRGGGGASHVKRSWMLVRKLNYLFKP